MLTACGRPHGRAGESHVARGSKTLISCGCHKWMAPKRKCMTEKPNNKGNILLYATSDPYQPNPIKNLKRKNYSKTEQKTMIGRLLSKMCSKIGQKSLQNKIAISALCKGN